MKKQIFLNIVAVGLLFVLVNALAQPRKSSPTKAFMRQKLEHSQRVLEGITLEDFDLVSKNAKKLSAMSQEVSWRAFENPEYIRYSDAFRRNVDELTRAAAERNLDGATLAYVKVTMSCVECHKFVRGKKAAWLKRGSPIFQSPL
jgi:hypothetical protein